jgi:mannosyl-3-phosphoglycerate phosphatase
MTIVFTDLDGTLLDGKTYSWEAARPALEQLRCRGIPCMLVTSKTRAEVEFWRTLMENSDPFIVENGAAVFIPKGYFPFEIPAAISRGNLEVLEWGTPYGVLIAALEETSRSARCRVLGFHQMTAQAVSVACGMPLDQAVLAKQREYDEPFLIVEPARADALLSELEARGLHWTEGGRFHHVCGANNKALAAKTVTRWFGQLHEHVTTIGLGDALNDAALLEAVDVPIVVRSRFSSALADRIPHAVLTEDPGPRGWNEAILRLIRSR